MHELTKQLTWHLLVEIQIKMPVLQSKLIEFYLKVMLQICDINAYLLLIRA